MSKRNIDPVVAHERAVKAATERTTPEYYARKLAESVDDSDDWAEKIAANLPPLTATEAAGIGKLAAALDARRATPDLKGAA